MGQAPAVSTTQPGRESQPTAGAPPPSALTWGRSRGQTAGKPGGGLCSRPPSGVGRSPHWGPRWGSCRSPEALRALKGARGLRQHVWCLEPREGLQHPGLGSSLSCLLLPPGQGGQSCPEPLGTSPSYTRQGLPASHLSCNGISPAEPDCAPAARRLSGDSRMSCPPVRTQTAPLRHGAEAPGGAGCVLDPQVTSSLCCFLSIETREGSSCRGSAVTNSTIIHEDKGSIPGLAHWVKDPALL